MSCLWKPSPDEMFHQKTFAKKALNFFVPGGSSQHFSHILQSQKLYLMASLFLLITHWTYIWLSLWAIQELYQTKWCPF